MHARLKSLHRDPRRGKVAGVCAGIANTFGMRPITIRIAFLLFLIMNPPVAVSLYVLGVFLLKRREDIAETQETPPEPAPETAQASVGDPARDEGGLPENLKFEALRKKFRDLEKRAAGLERTVTSEDYDLKRQFKEI